MNVKKIVIFLFLSLSFFSCEDAGKNNSITQPVAITFNKVQNDDLFEKITSDKSRLVFNNKIIHDLKSLKYKFRHSEILDLHGLTANEAEVELNSFIKENYHNSSKYLLIIHGKGSNNKDNQAPIKKLVEKFIINSVHILAANSANKNYGGFGATVLILKK